MIQKKIEGWEFPPNPQPSNFFSPNVIQMSFQKLINDSCTDFSIELPLKLNNNNNEIL